MDDTGPKSVSELIERRRKALAPKLSMREAAGRAGKSPSWWRMYETGERAPGPDAVAEMAVVVGITPDELEAEGYSEAAGALRRLLTARLETVSGLGAVKHVALEESQRGSDALLMDIVRGLDEIRNEPRLTPGQRRELETAFVRGLHREISAQLEYMRLVIRVAEGGK